MLLSTLETVPGKKIVRHYGLVTGSTVRTKHAGRDMMAGIKNFFGGELKGYTELLNESRKEAIKRMAIQAKQAGANGVINIRLATSSVAQGAAEVFAYGTAVSFEDAPGTASDLAGDSANLPAAADATENGEGI